MSDHISEITCTGGILVIAEHNDGSFHRVSYELLNVACGLAAKKPMPVTCLVLGPEGLPAEELCYRGAERVFYISAEEFVLPEEGLYKANIVPFLKQMQPEIVLIGATGFGRSLAPRLAAALKTGLTADCTGFDMAEDGKLVQIRPAFSDNIFAHIYTGRCPQMATVRYKEFSEAPRDAMRPAAVTKLAPYTTENSLCKVLSQSPTQGGDISESEVVVSAGRGVKRAEDLAMIKELAELLGGSMGVSRALVDAGVAGSEMQVGYSGHRVKPRLYVACGISGAPQHLAGMKESGMIVAINSDPSAPIFSIADIGCVGNLYEVVPELISYIKGRGAK